MQILPYRVCMMIAAAAMVLTGLAVDGSAQIREPVGDYGYIDWENQRLVAYGLGAAPTETRNVAQRRALSARAAAVDARRNLLEVVKGVHIDSATRVEDLMVTSDIIVTRVSGILEGSVVDENVYQSDGASRARVSIAVTGAMAKLLMAHHPPPPRQAVPPPPVMPVAPSVDTQQQTRLDQMETRITALEELVGQLVALNLQREKSPPGTLSAEQQMRMAQDLEALSQRLAALEQQKAPAAAVFRDAPAGLPAYTGLVIDARQQPFQPSMRPALYGEGNLLYPTASVNPDVATTSGYVRYFRELNQAQQSPMVGALPFTARVVGLHNEQKSDLVLAAQDAHVVMALLQKPDNFLRECRVVIVF